MTVKARVMERWRGYDWESFWRERPFAAQCVSLASQFFLGFMGGCVQILDRCGPFGLALVGRSGCGAAAFLEGGCHFG